MDQIEQKLEAILFYKNEPTSVKVLSKILNITEKEALDRLKNLQTSLQNRGLSLVLTEKEACLATSKEMANLIEQVARDEMSREIGKAGLETLSIIVYNSEGVSRRKIDYIRGVNSTFILRNLLARGLIEKEVSKEDQRTFVYRPTVLLLAHMGITSLLELPDYKNIRAQILTQETSNDGEN
ncbi:MAG: SMC-Scp complex subunit ScpB [Patescibacteria group bacterium]